MRCTCCNGELTDVDLTAKFRGSGTYADMCKECRSYLPSEVEVVTRRDLEKPQKPEVNKEVEPDPFDILDDPDWDSV